MWVCMCEPKYHFKNIQIRVYVEMYVGVCGCMWVYVETYVGVCGRMWAYVGVCGPRHLKA